MPRWLKRALYPLFWRGNPQSCPECGADVEMDAPLRRSRGLVWSDHGMRQHSITAMAAAIAEHQQPDVS